jgi:hypothetical protein
MRRLSALSNIPDWEPILARGVLSHPTAGSSETINKKEKAKASCDILMPFVPEALHTCYNLRSHLRTHTDERPFVCTICGKAFARQHDRGRHGGLHGGEKRFVCKSELGSGGTWDCGRFAITDALGRRFLSEVGRVCVKPLLDEDAAKQMGNRMFKQQQTNNVLGVGGFALPPALLAQYPALNNIDWPAMPQD